MCITLLAMQKVTHHSHPTVTCCSHVQHSIALLSDFKMHKVTHIYQIVTPALSWAACCHRSMGQPVLPGCSVGWTTCCFSSNTALVTVDALTSGTTSSCMGEPHAILQVLWRPSINPPPALTA